MRKKNHLTLLLEVMTIWRNCCKVLLWDTYIHASCWDCNFLHRISHYLKTDSMKLMFGSDKEFAANLQDDLSTCCVRSESHIMLLHSACGMCMFMLYMGQCLCG